MSYENRTNCEMVDCMPAPMECMTNMLHDTLCMAGEVGNLVRNISRHLFGARVNENSCGEAKRIEPICFNDELADTRRELKLAIAELAEICNRIGV